MYSHTAAIKRQKNTIYLLRVKSFLLLQVLRDIPCAQVKLEATTLQKTLNS